MATQKQARTRRLNMRERAEQQKELHFPSYPDALLWNRKLNDGFSTIPRTLPIAMSCIDAQSKGQPAGHVLLCLWVRAPDYPFLMIEAPATFAAEAGFEGERAIDTWRRRMRTLRALGFIETRHGPSGDFHYVLLLNPNVCIERMHRAGKVQTGLYARFLERLTDIGAQHDIAAYEEHLEETQRANAEIVKPTPDASEPPVKKSGTPAKSAAPNTPKVKGAKNASL